MTTKAIINKKLKTYENVKRKKRLQRYSENQKRLQQLVEQHGVENTALASGLSVSSVKHYIRVNMPPAISTETIEQAEHILGE